MAELVDVKKLKVAELRKLLQEKGLDNKGNKPELVQRLQEHLGENGTVEEDDDVLGNEEEEEDEEEEEEEEDVNGTEEVKETETELAPSPSKETHKIVSLSSVKATSPVSKTAPATIVSQGSAEVDKIAQRAQRFGTTALSSDAKKAARAARFGIPAPQTKSSTQTAIKSGTTTAASSVDLDKIKKRAERFGGSVSSTAVKLEEADKKKRRLERFGGATTISTSVGSGETEAKKQKRAERFGL